MSISLPDGPLKDVLRMLQDEGVFIPERMTGQFVRLHVDNIFDDANAKPDRKINCIKAVRTCLSRKNYPTFGLRDAKELVEDYSNMQVDLAKLQDSFRQEVGIQYYDDITGHTLPLNKVRSLAFEQSSRGDVDMLHLKNEIVRRLEVAMTEDDNIPF